jgi:hypothetical protein
MVFTETKLKGVNWIQLAQDKVQCSDFVTTAKETYFLVP